MYPFFAPCPRGLEPVLADELQALGAHAVSTTAGGVGFAGPFELCYRANLESRIASRILWRVGQTDYRNENDVYQATYDLPWHDWFDPARTLMVKVSAQHCPLRSLDFITLKIKDAICDKFRALSGRRPSVDTRQPDIRIHAYLDAASLTLYLDTSGMALFQRGYRAVTGTAPLRENLAAGILRLAGWEPGIALCDPMCGSGTFLAEAAQMALRMAPGLGRSFAFEKLKNFDAAAWNALRQQKLDERLPVTPLPIYGSDQYGTALDTARANLAAAGVAQAVQLKQANVLEISAPARTGVLVTNPPYGVRLGEQRDLAEFYPLLGDVLKKKFSGWRAYIFTADPHLPKLIRLAASRRIPLYNGPLECRLLEYRLVEGGMRRVKA